MIKIVGDLEWIRRYDAAKAKAGGETPDREAAIAELKALGLTHGEAIYALDRKKRA